MIELVKNIVKLGKYKDSGQLPKFLNLFEPIIYPQESGATPRVSWPVSQATSVTAL